MEKLKEPVSNASLFSLQNMFRANEYRRGGSVHYDSRMLRLA